MILYIDTSALVKLVLDENGSEEMVSVVDEANVLAASEIGYVELRASIAAALRDGRLDSNLRDDAVAQADSCWRTISAVPVSSALIDASADLAESAKLRAYDAVHLASLKQVGAAADVTFACWDRELRRGAMELGYRVVPAEL